MSEFTALVVALSLLITAGVSVSAAITGKRMKQVNEAVTEIHVMVDGRLTAVSNELARALTLLDVKYDDTTLGEVIGTTDLNVPKGAEPVKEAVIGRADDAKDPT